MLREEYDALIERVLSEATLTVPASKFTHKNESAHAGFYQVYLEDYNIDVALTASKRAGFHQYTFPKSEQANIILDLEHRDEVLESEST